MSPVGGLSHQGKIDPDLSAEKAKSTRDPKRRTVQVEYVAPQSQTTRGEVSPPAPAPPAVGKTPVIAPDTSRTRPKDVYEDLARVPRQSTVAQGSTKLSPYDPSILQNQQQDQAYPQQPLTAQSQQRAGSKQQPMAPPSRPPKDLPRSVSDSTSAFAPMSTTATGRPATGNSMSSGTGRLSSRGNSYSQPLAPTVAATNAQGRLAQPKNGKQYNISAPIPQPEPYYPEQSIGRPSTQQYSPAPPAPSQRDQQRGHKRSNTLGNILGRSGSVFGGRSSSQAQQEQKTQQEKRYPPTSMKGPITSDSPRQSTESRRSSSFGFGRKNSDLRNNSDLSKQEKPRRFSLLPASFSFKSFTGSTKDQSLSGAPPASQRRPSTMQQAPPSRGQSRPKAAASSQGQSRSNSYRNDAGAAVGFDGQRDSDRQQTRRNNGPSRGGPAIHQTQYTDNPNADPQGPLSPLGPPHGQSYLLGESGSPSEAELSVNASQRRPVYPPGFNSYEEESRPSMQQQSRNPRGPSVLQKNNRKFADAYEQDQEPGYGGGGRNAGSSGAAKRVMDFFRRRGKARSGDDRV